MIGKKTVNHENTYASKILIRQSARKRNSNAMPMRSSGEEMSFSCLC
jgi:hypothetical protein